MKPTRQENYDTIKEKEKKSLKMKKQDDMIRCDDGGKEKRIQNNVCSWKLAVIIFQPHSHSIFFYVFFFHFPSE
jgi:hypothetical protein